MFDAGSRSAPACAIVAVMLIAGGAVAQSQRTVKRTIDDRVAVASGPVAGFAGCAEGPEGDCCEANGTTGCSDGACCFLVCGIDAFCCEVEWDSICADMALDQCTSCGGTPNGACCVDESPLPLGGCSEVSEAACASMNGVFFGLASSCDQTICDLDDVSGACCIGELKVPGLTGPCVPFLVESFCNSIGGVWQGPESTCLGSDCLIIGISGACCLDQNENAAPSGCLDLGIIACKVIGGDWQGPGTSCLSFGDACDVPGPPGACCYPSARHVAGEFECEILPQFICENEGGTWQGPGTECAGSKIPCGSVPILGACCIEADDDDLQARAGGSGCVILPQFICENEGGSWQGPDTNCDDMGICDGPAIGACCLILSDTMLGDSNCVDDDQQSCLVNGGLWQGPGSACATFGGETCDDPCDDGKILAIELLTDDFGGETTIEVVDEETGDVLLALGPFDSNTEYEFNVCVDDGQCVVFTIYDSFGDGLCCGFGVGAYAVSFDGETVCEGSEFGASESCLAGDGCDDCNENDVPDAVETAPEPAAPLEDGAEDDCADAKHIGPGQYIGSNEEATSDGGLISCDGTIGLYDVWYRYRPAWNGPVIFSTLGSPTPVVLTVHDGCPVDGDTSFLACAVGADTDAKVLVERKADYWIRIAGVGAAKGAFQLSVIGPDSAPSLADCNNNGIPDDCECIGDLNADATVDVFDAALIWNRLGETCSCPEDLDGNGVIDSADATIVFENLGKCDEHEESPEATALSGSASNFGVTNRKDTPPVFLPERGF